MNSDYDETIYSDDPSYFNNCEFVSVTSDAEAWFVQVKLNKKVTPSLCDRQINESPAIDTNTQRLINLNPKIPCRSHNCYTLRNGENNPTVQTLIPFNQITVIDDQYEPTQFVTIDELRNPDIAFKFNDSLTTFDNAFMIKYYCHRASIKVTYDLYVRIKYLFDASAYGRQFFRFNNYSQWEIESIKQQFNLSRLYLDFSSPAIC